MAKACPQKTRENESSYWRDTFRVDLNRHILEFPFGKVNVFSQNAAFFAEKIIDAFVKEKTGGYNKGESWQTNCFAAIIFFLKRLDWRANGGFFCGLRVTLG